MRSAGSFAILALLALAGCRPASASPRAVPVPTDVAAGVRLTRIASGLAKPVAFAVAPGDTTGRLFVVEQTGKIRIIRDGVLLAEPFLDLTARVSTSADTRGSEQGLLGLAFHPRFAANGRFFVNFTDTTGTTRVVERTIGRDDPDRAAPGNERIVLSVDQPYANHNGGHLAFGPDGRLYVGLGDGGSAGDPKGNGQNPTSLLGKMLALDVDAGPDAKPTVVALGLRNPWRYGFDRETGDLWIADVGQNRFEEIDVLTVAMRTASAPTNFGWNAVEGMHCFRGPLCDQRRFTPPVLEYGHDDGCSITGGYVYRGTRLPALVGRYFFADYCTAIIRSVRRDGTTVRDVWDWRQALDPESRLASLSSFGEDAAGELYLLSLDGDVYRFDPR